MPLSHLLGALRYFSTWPAVAQVSNSALTTCREVQNRARRRLDEVDRVHGEVASLFDTFNRRHDYLRISLTERCNLRCSYCMPSEGVELSPSANLLSDDEVIKLAKTFVKNGVTKIRLTGGEPTIRKNIVELVGRLNELRKYGLKSIAMTSNGLAMHRKLQPLIDNGLTHLNLSLDTLDPYKFEIMTRRSGHAMVLRTLDLAMNAKALQSVKLNAVIIRGLNDTEVPDFVELTKDNALSVRFIEFMPFTGNKWDRSKMVSSSELLSHIAALYPKMTKLTDEVNDTARSYKIPGHKGAFGFISSMSDHFCGTCNRLRLTADGQIKVCLFDTKEVSLRDLLRRNASEEELLHVIRAALRLKKEKHAGMDDIDVVNNRPMILIGDAPRKRVIRHIQPILLSKGLPVSKKRSFYISSTLRQEGLTHIDSQGRASMVNVSAKETTRRTATAQGRIYIPKIAYDLIQDSSSNQEINPADTELSRQREKAKGKGDVFTVAQLAGIMASKRTSDLIPLCHPIPLSHVAVKLKLEVHTSGISNERKYSILCLSTVTCDGKTGVEMEALTAVSVSLLTVWDMLKAVGGDQMMVEEVCVIEKTGGKSGDFVRHMQETDSMQEGR